MALQPTLKRFDVLVTKDRNPPADLVQIPADATVAFYAQGATVKPGEGLPIPPNYFEDIAVDVWHLGSIKVNEDIRVNNDATKKLHVTSVEPENFIIWVTNQGTATIVLFGGERLFREVGKPLVYKDPTGQVSTGSSTLATVNGRAEGYIRDYRYDVIISIAGTTIQRV